VLGLRPEIVRFSTASATENGAELMGRTFGRFLLGISLAISGITTVQAVAADAPTKKDPIEDAFALPKNAKLDAGQQEQFDKLRAEKEPELKAALDDYQAAKDSAGKTAGMKKVNLVKKDIKTAIGKILHPKSDTSTKKPAVTKPKREPVVKPKKEKPIRASKRAPGQPNVGGNPPVGGF
jgi:hypothetical protein